MITEDEKAEAERAIFAYLSDRNAWEREAWKLSPAGQSYGAWSKVRDAIQAGYDSLIQRHCAPRVVALGLRSAYGHPPSVDPNGTRIVSMKRHRGAIKVLTDEGSRDGLGSVSYEYELVEIDGVLKLSERRARFPGQRPIREVW